MLPKNNMTEIDYLEAGFVKWQYDHEQQIRQTATKEEIGFMAPLVLGAASLGLLGFGTVMYGAKKVLQAAIKDSSLP